MTKRNPVAEIKDQQNILKWMFLIQAMLALPKDQKAAMIWQMQIGNFIRDWPQIADVVYGGENQNPRETVPLIVSGVTPVKGTMDLLTILMGMLNKIQNNEIPTKAEFTALIAEIVAMFSKKAQ